MKLSSQEFRNWDNKRITLLGMSGVGKTTLAALLPRDQWFHYSGDYRIGTRYLDEAILDQVKLMAMQHPYLRKQLRNDSIYIRNNITIDNLGPVSDFLGKIGNPDLGGLPVDEFKRRQRLFRAAEVGAMRDVDEFIVRGRTVYGYPHFINDAGGSIYGLSDAECWDRLSANTLVIYLRADHDMEETLIERAQRYPKPLNYEESFLDEQLAEYLADKGIDGAGDVAPDEFVQWIFPRLLEWRRPQYQRIADKYGHTANAGDIMSLRDESDFTDYICAAIDSTGG